MTTEASVLDQLLARIENLYTLPVVAMKVLQLTRSETAGASSLDFRKLKETIEQDPALVARFLQAANGRALGVSREVKNLTEALALLGTSAIEGLVLGFCLPEKLTAGVDVQVLQEFWRQTVTRSLAARACAGRLGWRQVDDAFVAALLMDIGMLALIQELEQSYIEFIREARQHQQDLCEMEVASLGFDHRVLSSRLLDRWDLPASIVQAVGQVHLLDPEDPNHVGSQLMQILYASDQAAAVVTHGESISAGKLLAACKSFFSWDETTVRAWLDEVMGPSREFAESLQVELGATADYRTLLQEAELRRQESKSRRTETRSQGSPATAGDPPPLSQAVTSSLDGLEQSVERWQDAEASSGLDALANGLRAKPSVSDHPSGTTENWADDPGVIGRVAEAVRDSRNQRLPLSLILAQIDDFSGLMFSESVEGVYRIQQSVLTALERLSRDEHGQVLEISDHRFAIVLMGLERSESTRVGQSILQLIRQWSRTRNDKKKCSVSLSLGCASTPIPSKNFGARTLIEAAQRCLDSVSLAQGNSIKSIDIYY